MEIVLGVFGNLANMVAKSPLAEVASAEYELFKSGKISELDPE